MGGSDARPHTSHAGARQQQGAGRVGEGGGKGYCHCMEHDHTSQGAEEGGQEAGCGLAVRCLLVRLACCSQTLCRGHWWIFSQPAAAANTRCIWHRRCSAPGLWGPGSAHSAPFTHDMLASLACMVLVLLPSCSPPAVRAMMQHLSFGIQHTCAPQCSHTLGHLVSPTPASAALPAPHCLPAIHR